MSVAMLSLNCFRFHLTVIIICDLPVNCELNLCAQVFGLGSVAQVVTGQGAFGQYLSINLGFALGVAMGVHVGGKVSGMRLANPTFKNP